MNVDDEDEVDHILAQANKFVPDSAPELLGAVRAGLPQFMLYAQRGSMAPRAGSNGRWRIGRDPCQGSCLSHGYGCGCETLPHAKLQY